MIFAVLFEIILIVLFLLEPSFTIAFKTANYDYIQISEIEL